RFPGSMATRLQALAAVVEERYDGDVTRLWTEPSTGKELLARVMELPGFGKQKAQIFVALLAKQLGVRPGGWEAAVGAYAEQGHRSVADVVDPESLQKVRDFKKQAKVAAKAR
uniref:HhH-GPD-type base excision DNA repair protein n=1 Tax=Nocardioides sp. TaxID=35761 RepID=UPI00356A2347